MNIGFILFAFSLATSAKATEIDVPCATKISDKVCFVEWRWQADCSEEPSDFKKYDLKNQIDTIYFKSPSFLQKSFCELDKVMIATDQSAWSAPFYSNNNLYISFGAVVASQLPYKRVLEGRFYAYNTAQYRVEGENYFFVITDWRNVIQHIQYKGLKPDEINLNLANMLIHEVSHMIEEQLVAENSLPGHIFECVENHQKNNELQFLNTKSHLKGYRNVFPDQFPRGLNSDLLIELSNSPYTTFYGMQDKREDFAETLTEWVMHSHFGVHFQLVHSDGTTLFDNSKQQKNPAVKKKIELVKAIVNLDELPENKLSEFKKGVVSCSWRNPKTE